MENPKQVHSALVGFTIAGSLGFIALSLYLWEIWPIAVWGLFLIGSAVVFAIITVIYGVTVWPILLLIGRVFDRPSRTASSDMEPTADGVRRRPVAWLVIGLLLLGAASFFSYRSGCAFDGKGGYGGPVRGQFYEFVAGLLLLGEIGCFGLAGLLRSQRRWLQAVLVAAAVLLVGPVSFYPLFDVSIRGIILCKPA